MRPGYDYRDPYSDYAPSHPCTCVDMLMAKLAVDVLHRYRLRDGRVSEAMRDFALDVLLILGGRRREPARGGAR